MEEELGLGDGGCSQAHYPKALVPARIPPQAPLLRGGPRRCQRCSSMVAHSPLFYFYVSVIAMLGCVVV